MSSHDTSQAPPQFANTRWTLVAALGQGDEGAERPLLELCLHNWYPVYSYLRRCGHPPGAAQELTRAFFEQLLHGAPGQAQPAQFGRFREFLVAELQRFLAQGLSHPGPGAPRPPLELDEMEARQRTEAAFAGSPEQALRRGFALEVIARARDRLRGEAREAGRLAMYEAMERYLTSDPLPGEFEQLAQRFGVRPLFVVTAMKRLRERFRELVDNALGDTVLNSSELDVERRALQDALSGVPG
jgi:hypothetical protein